MAFSEDFLHYLWKFRLFDPRELKTVSGDLLEIISNGIHNKDSGPDFEQAKIRIGDTLWAGNVEIHLNSSDWDKHQHSADKAYNSVILHVVFNYDKAVFRNELSEIQTLELKNRIPAEIEWRYEQLMHNINWIPCERQIAGVDKFHINNWLSRVLIERMEEKARIIKVILEEYKGSWDDTFYVMLARNFGFKTNAVPFELLARSLPRKILNWHKGNNLQIESLIFGQAGFLTGKIHDSYPKVLQKEYTYLKKKYSLVPCDRFIWKFLRMRPQNFPSLRLAQFAALIIKSNHLFSKVLEIREANKIHDMFTDLSVHDYWNTHFRFEKEANVGSAQPGNDAINNILLNTVSVFLYAYGRQTDDIRYTDRAFTILESLPSEINLVTRRFTDIGIKSLNGETSQALLQLKKYYCDAKKCLHCGIGVKVINQT